MMEKAKLTIEYQDKKITIETQAETTDDFVDKLLKPMMLALEFHPDSVDSMFNQE